MKFFVIFSIFPVQFLFTCVLSSGTTHLDCDRYCKKQPCKDYYTDETKWNFKRCNETAPFCNTPFCQPLNIESNNTRVFLNEILNPTGEQIQTGRKLPVPFWLVWYGLGGIAALAIFGKYLGCCAGVFYQGGNDPIEYFTRNEEQSNCKMKAKEAEDVEAGKPRRIDEVDGGGSDGEEFKENLSKSKSVESEV